MESITSVKIFHGSEFKANGKVIRWTEVRLASFLPRLSVQTEAFISVSLFKKKNAGSLTGANVCLCAGVFPPERGLPGRAERPRRPQQADGERGEGFLRGAASTPETAQGRRDGQTGTAGHAGLGPGRLYSTKRAVM